MRKSIFAVALLFFAITSSLAQRPGGHGTGGGGGQARGGMGQGMQSQGQRGQGAQDQQRTQTRQRLHVTDQQQQQMTNCIRSVERIRARTREMAKVANAKEFNAAEAKRVREQLRLEMQAMNQDHEEFLNGLSEEQKAAVQTRAEEVQRSREELQNMSDALDLALQEDSLQTGTKVREQAREMEQTAKELVNQQREIARNLGIEP